MEVSAFAPEELMLRFQNTVNKDSGQQIRSKIESIQNANFLITQSNPMV